MRESESFDAFYARTVASVTSQIHEIADGDPQADHAIREAYARAYQQWYEVSGFRDADSWVLDTAKEAFERRRAETGPEPEPSSASGSWPGQMRDSGSWPGWFRPRPPADLAAAVAAPPAGTDPSPGQGASADELGFGPERPGGRQPGGVLSAIRSRGALRGPATEPAGPRPAGPQPAGTEPTGPWPAGPGPAGRSPMPPRRGSPGAGGFRPNWTGIRGGTRTLIIACVVAAVVAAGVVYFALGNSSGPGNSHAAGNGPSPRLKHPGKPVLHMLKAGLVGSRADIPWPLVGPGWTLAEVSTAAPGAALNAGGGATYLVDPVGGRYLDRKWSVSTAPSLLAWSGDGKSAAFSSAGGYFVLTLASGQVTPLQLPANVAVAGFTRPKGLALLAVKQGPARFQLVRYDLLGNFQASIASMPHSANAPSWTGCGDGCAALSSPDGDQAVWGALGAEMQLVDNTGGIVKRLHVPDSGHPPHCTPISWWDATTVLASCSAGGGQSVATQLWLVPKDGSQGQALTAASGSGAGVGFDTGAWQANGQDYVTQTTGAQCPGAPTGPGGLEILGLSSSGATAPVDVTDSTNNHNSIVGTYEGRLLVIAQMSCPGSYALMWFSPANGGVPQILIPAAANQTGVVAAVPWGSGTVTAGN